MPSYRHHTYGDMYVKFDIKFPKSGEIQNVELLEQVLPPRLESVKPPPDAMVEDLELQQASDHDQARADNAVMEDDEEEDGIPGGGERVQCASQ